MKLGRYTIKGISKRFWAVLALVVIIPIVAFLLWPQSEPTPYVLNPSPDNLSSEFFSDPVLNAERLDSGSSKDDWYQIGREPGEQAIGPSWDPLRWQNDTIQTKVYVPNEEQRDEIQANRPSLVRQDPASGLQFYPAFVILPDRPLSPNSRSAWPSNFANGEEDAPWIQMVSEEILPSGEYNIRGLLYARSNELNKLSSSEVEADYPKWIPTVLLADAQKISPAEAEAPADRRAEINIPVQYGDYEIILKSLEWSSGREVRLCVGWRNASVTRPYIPFPETNLLLSVETNDFPLISRAEESGQGISSAPLRLESGEPAYFSYWVVPSADTLPPDPENISLSFRIPRLGSAVPVSKIEINQDDFQEPGVKDMYRWGGCSES